MSVVVAMIGLQAASALIGGISANSRRIKAKGKQEAAQAKLTALENNRQPVINPYEGVTDLSGMLSNPAANLGVATQAAEMQIEQADISLANTLDTIRATGGGAGGATALAQAALQSKKGVSASIEQQEAQNEKLKAQGEQQLQQARMSEAQRVQQADVSGKQFMFGAQEQREMTQLDRADAQMQNAEAQKIQAGADITGAITGAIGGVASGLGSLAASDYDFKNN
tara:strand:- start:2065 stop:2742 length:678 start_codon:yes stop_codon:yes gene_type:complete